MYAEQELRDLIKNAERRGTKIKTCLDQDILEEEGREIIETVQIGDNPPISAFAAVERMRASYGMR